VITPKVGVDALKSSIWACRWFVGQLVDLEVGANKFLETYFCYRVVQIFC